ncbi:MAG: ATP-dependent helicase/deoxyribonuclease subunit B [Methanomassiliicoccales archaeon PtaB.Bin134]|nr:MAG: ATP-dependent helicase/deoxyribonuclease subunit B [Methanomassiliicoccales archaeon PtaB.Bin134]
MGKIRFIRGAPRELYGSAISHFLDDFKASPLEVALVVPRPGMAMNVRSELLRGRTVPTFCVTDQDDLTHYLFDHYEKELRPVGGLGLRIIIRSILMENAKHFPMLFREGEVQDGILDDLYTLARTLRDFRCGLSDFRMDEVMGVDVPLFISLYERRLEDLGLVDAIGKRNVVASKAEEWTRERPFFRKVVILGGFEPTPSQLSVIRALIRGSSEAIYLHPFVPGIPKVFQQEVLDLGVELEVEDLPIADEELGRMSLVREWGTEDKVDLSGEIQMGRFLDPLSEARQAAQRISELIEKGEDPESIAIFLPDRREALPLMREVLDDFNIPFKTDLGIPLSTSPAVQSAVSVLEAVARGYEPSAMIRLLSSPYVRWAFEGEGLWHVEVDRFSRMAGVLRGRESWMNGLQNLADELQRQCLDPEVPDFRKRSFLKDAERAIKVKRSLEALFFELEVLEGSKSFTKHLRDFRQCLELLGMSEAIERTLWNDPDSMEGRAFRKLLGLLSHLETEEASEQRITLSEFISELKREVGELSFYPGRRSDRAVNVAGYRSLAGRHFEHSFMLFTLEGDMPKLGVKHPFITAAQAKKMGLLDEDDILRQERFYFLNAVLSGSTVSISYPSYNGGKKVLPSPFLFDLERNCLLGKMDEVPITRSMRCAHISLGRSLADGVTEGREEWLPRSTISPCELCERLNVERVERQGPYLSEHDGVLAEGALLDEIRTKLQNKVFSATMLETYRRCPMSYFLKYVLYLSPLEGEEDSEALRIGNAAHQALFRFYRERIERGMGMPSAAEDREAVKAELRRIGEEVSQQCSIVSAESEANLRALFGDPEMNGVVGKFIDYQVEVDRPRWSPAHLEYSFGSPFSVERNDAASTEEPVPIQLSEDPEDKILLRGKVDRVDTDGDDFLIIDYKTGSIPSFTSINRGYNMQLPLYLMACEQLLHKEPAGGAYYQLKNDDKFGMHLRLGSQKRRDELGGSSTVYKDGLRNGLAVCRRNVKEVLEGISSAAFHPVDSTESERCSPHCLFSRICRKDPMRVLQMSLAREVE